MIADGITPEQLVGHNSASSKGNKSASRVRLNIVLPIIPAPRKLDGQGRMPKPLAKAMAEAKSLIVSPDVIVKTGGETHRYYSRLDQHTPKSPSSLYAVTSAAFSVYFSPCSLLA